MICENGVAHTGTETFVIDPDRDFSDLSNFEGHKYICEQCGRLIANALGAATTEQVRRAEFDRDVAQQELTNVRQRVEKLSKDLSSDISSSVTQYQGATFEDLFTPPPVDVVAKRSSNGISTVESVPVKESSGSARKKSAAAASGNDS